MQPALRQRLLTETFLRDVEWHPELESTNTRALQLGQQAEHVPVLIWTASQTAGRGRGHNSWWTSGGALTFTVLLEPEAWGIPRPQWPALSLGVGTAVCLMLQRLQLPEVALKWPNDVYVADRKVCGILIESVSGRPERLAIGIGLNVNNEFSGAPSEVRQRATSVREQLDMELVLDDVLILLLQELDQLMRLMAKRPEELQTLWRNLCWLTGKSISVVDVKGTVRGQVLGINASGELLLQTSQGMQRIRSGTIEVAS